MVLIVCAWCLKRTSVCVCFSIRSHANSPDLGARPRWCNTLVACHWHLTLVIFSAALRETTEIHTIFKSHCCHSQTLAHGALPSTKCQQSLWSVLGCIVFLYYSSSGFKVVNEHCPSRASRGRSSDPRSVSNENQPHYLTTPRCCGAIA